jgi:hypothetical protein
VLTLASEAVLLLHAWRARKARQARDGEACHRHVLRALRAAMEDRIAGGAAGDCEPVMRTRGGFFSCLAAIGGARCFVKCVLTGSREVSFWRAWRDGLVGTRGRHYRLLPPTEVVSGRLVSVLVFPEFELLKGSRRRRYEREIERIAQAVADFNSDHVVGPQAFTASRSGAAVAVPRRRQVETALGVDRVRAGEIVAALRHIEAGWDEVRRPLGAALPCLSHMDLGRGNVVFNRGRGLLIDFAHAGAAPAGADLHTLLRYRGEGGPGADDLVARYVSVFAGKGISLDAKLVRLSLDVHFAERYRNLNFASARDPKAFEAALALSLAMVEGRRPGGLSAFG